MKEAFASAKDAIAIAIGSGLIAGALIYQVHQRRYEVTASLDNVYRLDTVTGLVSACTVISAQSSLGPIAKDRVAVLLAGGFSAEEVAKYFAEHQGQTMCSRWGQ